MLNGLDLFSGIGGISIALRDWVKPIAYCEIDRYAQAVLLSRMQDGLLSRAPIWDDVTTLDGKQFRGQIDIIYGGFPCQDISVAGNGKGLAGNRSWLFKEIMRLAEEIKPKFIFLENVPAIRTRGLDHVAEWLASSGYDCRWDFISAEEIGAPHRRQRWFLLAHSNGSNIRKQQRGRGGADRKSEVESRSNGEEKSLADSSRKGLERPAANINKWQKHFSDNGSFEGARSVSSRGHWSIEPNVGRVVNGLPYRVDRIKGLGNAVVPEQAKEAFMRLSGQNVR